MLQDNSSSVVAALRPCWTYSVIYTTQEAGTGQGNCPGNQKLRYCGVYFEVSEVYVLARVIPAPVTVVLRDSQASRGHTNASPPTS